MKKVLIISPYFPPVNGADMQRVRMSLPYFKKNGWIPTVITIEARFSDLVQDTLLEQSIPKDISIVYIKAFSKKWTSKFGLGSIALRSLWFYVKEVNRLLRNDKYDLIYFSTTEFPVCVLGSYWKKKFGIRYVIDMQDPWISDYYKNKPASQRPPKYWFSSRLNKFLEPIAMKHVDGLISVSDKYIIDLKERYSNCRKIPHKVITFGASDLDKKIAIENKGSQPSLLAKNINKINIVYAGRGGLDMQKAIRLLFVSFSEALKADPNEFKNFHFYFIGTSYASAGKAVQTIKPVSESEGIGQYVTEITDRIPFYQSMNTLMDGDALFIPGSDDPQYTASKIFPYMLSEKPLLAIFHPESSVVRILKECGVGFTLTLDNDRELLIKEIKSFLRKISRKELFNVVPNPEKFYKYSAEAMTLHQCNLFNTVLA